MITEMWSFYSNARSFPVKYFQSSTLVATDQVTTFHSCSLQLSSHFSEARVWEGACMSSVWLGEKPRGRRNREEEKEPDWITKRVSPLSARRWRSHSTKQHRIQRYQGAMSHNGESPNLSAQLVPTSGRKHTYRDLVHKCQLQECLSRAFCSCCLSMLNFWLF